jgi:hypothetical protein
MSYQAFQAQSIARIEYAQHGKPYTRCRDSEIRRHSVLSGFPTHDIRRALSFLTMA